NEIKTTAEKDTQGDEAQTDKTQIENTQADATQLIDDILIEAETGIEITKIVTPESETVEARQAESDEQKQQQQQQEQPAATEEKLDESVDEAENAELNAP